MRVTVMSDDDPGWRASRSRCQRIERPFVLRLVLVAALVAILLLVGARLAALALGVEIGGAGAALAAASVIIGNVVATATIKRAVDGSSEAADERLRRAIRSGVPGWRANPVTVSGGSWVPARRRWTGTADRGALVASDEGLLFVPGRLGHAPALLAWSDIELISVVGRGTTSSVGMVVTTPAGERVVRTSRALLLAGYLTTSGLADRPA